MLNTKVIELELLKQQMHALKASLKASSNANKENQIKINDMNENIIR